MACTSPRTVGFKSDGKTVTWSHKQYSPEYPSFQLPCGKCLQCRLKYAREWALRCVHEAQMHPKNCFITLTYSEENLKSPKLVYSDFQKFMKKLRKTQEEPIGVFVTGEYGELNKRPHFHAILFNWRPTDLVYFRSNKRGDRIYRSVLLDKIWANGFAEVGDVTFESAGYCARYAAKKIVHTPNNKLAEADYHEFQPISKKSSKHAIGKRWIEKYHEHVFSTGACFLRGGIRESIPRYYERWYKQHHYERWIHYVTHTKQDIIRRTSDKTKKENRQYWETQDRRGPLRPRQLTPNETKRIILEAKFTKLMEYTQL